MARRSLFAVAALLVVGAASGGLLIAVPSSVEPTSDALLDGGATATPPDNPWRADPVVVAVTAPSGSSRQFAPLVHEALDYWEGDGAAHRVHDANFVLRPNATDPDVRVRFVWSIDSCSRTDVRAIGCAPQLGPNVRVSGTTTVRVETGWTDETTITVLKHEFGHVLGVGHGSDLPFMRATNEGARHLPVTNASDRPFPWRTTALSVHVAAPPENATAARNATVEAIDYYESGADGWAETRPQFTLVDDSDEADVVVRYANATACPGGRPLCWRVSGDQADSDSAPEYFTRVNATVAGVDPDRSEWYVGYVLAVALGADGREDMPDPFRKPEEADDRWFD